jgi:hypothetical protein
MKCDECKFEMKTNCYQYVTRCLDCEQYGGQMDCRCDDVEDIENCPYFKPKNQTAMKPEYLDGDPDRPICPRCRMMLREMEDCDCGQKIDWSDNNEN